MTTERIKNKFKIGDLVLTNTEWSQYISVLGLITYVTEEDVTIKVLRYYNHDSKTNELIIHKYWINHV